jgi:hypothetical protein
MAKKNLRSNNTPTSTTPPAPERRRTVRATTRTRTTTPETSVAEPDNSPAVVRATANDLQAQGDGITTQAPTFDQIAEAAYHRYLQRGGEDGHDFDDWIDAERSLRSRN